MSVIAGYAYFSQDGRYLAHDFDSGLPYIPPVVDTVYVYAIYDDGSAVFQGSATYWAAYEYYYPGAAYGYEPPPAEPPRGDAEWDESTWLGWTGTGTEFWDLKYGLSNDSLIHAAPATDVARAHTLIYNSGDSLLGGGYDLTEISGSLPVSGKEYIAVVDWAAPTVVRGVVELTDSLWPATTAPKWYHLADYFVPTTPPDPPVATPFWTAFVGTEETP
jgi:hypothetical protein